MSHKINKVAIFGGTHGNELTGVFQVKKYQQSPDLIQPESFKTVAFLANPEAIKKVLRYIDTDLNRCFKSEDLLNQNLINYEQQLAKKIAEQMKEENIDFIIDIHSTTSNMGLTIILHNENPYLLRLAAYLSAINPLVKVLKYPLNPNPPYLRAITEMGLGIEVGAIAQGVLNA
ncbi:MAG TPA: aspartoacylase, partial [Allocoleopsis sp.]